MVILLAGTLSDSKYNNCNISKWKGFQKILIHVQLLKSYNKLSNITWPCCIHTFDTYRSPKPQYLAMYWLTSNWQLVWTSIIKQLNLAILTRNFKCSTEIYRTYLPPNFSKYFQIFATQEQLRSRESWNIKVCHQFIFIVRVPETIKTLSLMYTIFYVLY